MALEYEYEGNDEEHISSEDFLNNEREAQKKQRQEKRLRKKYKFSDKIHSRTGIASSLCALAALIFLIMSVILSVHEGGNGGLPVGIFGALSFVTAIAGIITGLISFRNPDVIYKYAWIGLIANGVIWILVAILMVMGM